MEHIVDFFTNPCIIASLSSWITAQILKVFTHAIVHKKIEIKRILGDGGMPSGHTATVTSLMAMTGLTCGFGSPEFAISFILTVIVCRDAMGIRKETEHQARAINALLKAVKNDPNDELPDKPLNIFVGHSLPQVIAGAILGIGMATGIYFIWFA